MKNYDHEIKFVKIKTLAGTEEKVKGNLEFIDLWMKVNDTMWKYKKRDFDDNF